MQRLKQQMITRLWGQQQKTEQKTGKIKEAEEAQSVPASANLGSFPALSGLPVNGPPNEKPNTLHSAFIVGVHFGMGSF